MREAEIVSTARTPIGRALRGGLNSIKSPTLMAPLPRSPRNRSAYFQWRRHGRRGAVRAALICSGSALPPAQVRPVLRRNRPNVGLLSVHSRYGLRTRQVAVIRPSTPKGCGCFVTSTAALIATGWSNSCRVGSHPKRPRLLSGALLQHPSSLGEAPSVVVGAADLEMRCWSHELPKKTQRRAHDGLDGSRLPGSSWIRADAHTCLSPTPAAR